MKDKKKKEKIDEFLDKRMESVDPEYKIKWRHISMNNTLENCEPIYKISYTEEEVKELLQKYSNEHSFYQWENNQYICKSNDVNNWFEKNKKTQKTNG